MQASCFPIDFPAGNRETGNKEKESEPLQSKTEEAETEGRAWADSIFIDPKDFEENFTYVEELNKKLAYHRWDNELQEARLLEEQNLF